MAEALQYGERRRQIYKRFEQLWCCLRRHHMLAAVSRWRWRVRHDVAQIGPEAIGGSVWSDGNPGIVADKQTAIGHTREEPRVPARIGESGVHPSFRDNRSGRPVDSRQSVTVLYWQTVWPEEYWRSMGLCIRCPHGRLGRRHRELETTKSEALRRGYGNCSFTRLPASARSIRMFPECRTAVDSLHGVLIDILCDRLAYAIADPDCARVVHATPYSGAIPIRPGLLDARIRAVRLTGSRQRKHLFWPEVTQENRRSRAVLARVPRRIFGMRRSVDERQPVRIRKSVGIAVTGRQVTSIGRDP
jgi:hypothetical protein